MLSRVEHEKNLKPWARANKKVMQHAIKYRDLEI